MTPSLSQILEHRRHSKGENLSRIDHFSPPPLPLPGSGSLSCPLNGYSHFQEVSLQAAFTHDPGTAHPLSESPDLALGSRLPHDLAPPPSLTCSPPPSPWLTLLQLQSCPPLSWAGRVLSCPKGLHGAFPLPGILPLRKSCD